MYLYMYYTHLCIYSSMMYMMYVLLLVLVLYSLLNYIAKKKKTTKQFNNKIKVSVAWLKAKAKATRRE